MKKLLPILIAAGLLSALILVACCGNPPVIFPKTINALDMKPGEDTIDLSQNPIEKKMGLLQMDVFYNDVLINRKKHPSVVVETLDVNALANLQDSAFYIGGATPRHYILALKIIHGLDSLYNKMELLYEPLFLQSTDSTKKQQAEYQIVNHPVYYKYNPVIEQFYKVSDTVSSIARYQDSISFKNRYQQTFRRFNNTADIKGDVKSLIFPFQEIDSVIVANNSGKMYLFNAGEYIVDKKDIYIKHVLLLGADDVNKDFIFYSRYGNLSHLCPPSCDKHTYDIRQVIANKP